jgi:SAM-dependent methyltransferase
MTTSQVNRKDVFEREKAFHDHIFEKEYGDNERNVTLKYYDTTRASEECLHRLVTQYSVGKVVLEYGCGPGGSTLLTLANGAAHVTGIDLSETAIRKAKEQAAEQQATAQTDYFVMNGEDLTFAPQTFDVCYGNSILHHLDTEQAYRQIARVLRSDGVAIFREPLGMNPLINLYRKLTPRLRTPDEHPFVMHDIRLAKKIFANVEVEYFTCVALATTAFRNLKVFPTLLRWAEKIDSGLFRMVPFMRRFAWMSVITMSHPRAVSSSM